MTNDEPDPQALSCPEMVELLTDYLDGALSPQDTVSFDAHLGRCAGCATYVDQFRETIRATGTLAEGDIDESVMSELLTGFRDWRARRAT